MSSRYTPILTHSHQAALIKVLGRMIKLGEADEQLVGAYEAIANAKEGNPLSNPSWLQTNEAPRKSQRPIGICQIAPA
jgi:hypothetical protein